MLSGTRQYALASVAVLFTLAVSFFAVRWFFADSPPRLRALDPKEIRQATQLREFESELVLLLEDFLTHLPDAETVETGTFEDWTKQSFRPRVSDLQHRLFKADLPRRPYASLLDAADKASAIGSEPLNNRLRNIGVVATLEALEETERFIEELNLDISLSPDAPTPSARMQRIFKGNSR